jgi:hypothetical protein
VSTPSDGRTQGRRAGATEGQHVAGLGSPAGVFGSAARTASGPSRRLGSSQDTHPVQRGQPADTLPGEREEEGGRPIEGVVEDGLERVTELGVRVQLGLAEERDGGPEQLDAGERVGLARQE